MQPRSIPFARPALGDEEIAAVTATLRSGWIALGPKTKEFERAFAERVGGTACDMESLIELAHERDLRIIEDAAHALPTTYRGRMIGDIGDVTVFSFYATKTLATGDGGMLTARDPSVRRTARTLSLHGM